MSSSRFTYEGESFTVANDGSTLNLADVPVGVVHFVNATGQAVPLPGRAQHDILTREDDDFIRTTIDGNEWDIDVERMVMFPLEMGNSEARILVFRSSPSAIVSEVPPMRPTPSVQPHQTISQVEWNGRTYRLVFPEPNLNQITRNMYSDRNGNLVPFRADVEEIISEYLHRFNNDADGPETLEHVLIEGQLWTIDFDQMIMFSETGSDARGLVQGREDANLACGTS